jgi:hypothetical protein
VRWDTGTLRVVFLVASAVSAGYLWRAALEGDSELGRLLDTSSPGIVAPAPSGPVWNLGGAPDRELGAERRRSAAVEPEPPPRPAAKGKRPAAKPKGPAQRPPRPAPRPEAAPTVARPQPPAPKPEPAAPTPKPAPKPAPKPPTPQPKPPTGGSGPTGGAPAPAPPAPAPAPAGSGQPAPAPPAPTPPPDAEPAAVVQRPGWGHGDKNHDHTGPPAKKEK